MKIRLIALVGALLVIGSSPACAGDGLYLGLGAGLDFQNDVSLNELRAPFANGQFSTDVGGIVAGTVGFKFPLFPVRLELESSYAFHGLSSVQNVDGGSAAATGHSNIQAEIANAIYEFPVAPAWNLYAGAGIGAGQVNSTAVLSGTGYQVADVDHEAIIWQVIGGASFEVTPDVDLFVDYRYRDAHARDIVFVPSVGPVLSGITTENVIMTGIRFYPAL